MANGESEFDIELPMYGDRLNVSAVVYGSTCIVKVGSLTMRQRLHVMNSLLNFHGWSFKTATGLSHDEHWLLTK